MKTIRVCSPVIVVTASTVGVTGVTIVFAAVIADGDDPTGTATRLTAPVLFEGDMGDSNLGNRRNRDYWNMN